MSWTTITEATLHEALTEGEVSAVQSAALASGEPDPVPETIRKVVGEVRGYIGACEKNKLGPLDTVPDQLVSAALSIIRFRLLNRFPELGLQTDARKSEYDNALVLLRDVAACRFAVEQPPADEVGPEVMPSGAGTKLVHRTRLRFSRHQTDRL